MDSVHQESNADVTGDVLECHLIVSNISHDGVQNDADMLTKLSQDFKKKCIQDLDPTAL